MNKRQHKEAPANHLDKLPRDIALIIALMAAPDPPPPEHGFLRINCDLCDTNAVCATHKTQLGLHIYLCLWCGDDKHFFSGKHGLCLLCWDKLVKFAPDEWWQYVSCAHLQ